jgi:hypothetical protein
MRELEANRTQRKRGMMAKYCVRINSTQEVEADNEEAAAEEAIDCLDDTDVEVELIDDDDDDDDDDDEDDDEDEEEVEDDEQNG